MSAIIGANTDQLRETARQMRAVVRHITEGTGTMCASLDALLGVWEGRASEQCLGVWENLWPHYPRAAERLEHFANELEALATRLEDADAVFGQGSAGGRHSLIAAALEALREQGLLGHLRPGDILMPWSPLTSLLPLVPLLPHHRWSDDIGHMPDTQIQRRCPPPPRVYIINGIRPKAGPGEVDSVAKDIQQRLLEAGYNQGYADEVVALNAAYSRPNIGTAMEDMKDLPDAAGTNLQGTDFHGTNFGGLMSPMNWVTGGLAMTANAFTGAGTGIVNTVTGTAANTYNTVTNEIAPAVGTVVDGAIDSADVYSEYVQGENGTYTKQMIEDIKNDLEENPLMPGQQVVLIGHSGGGAIVSNVAPILEERRGVDVAGVVGMGSPIINADAADNYATVLSISDKSDPIGQPYVRSEEGHIVGPLMIGLSDNPLLGALGGLTVDQVLRDSSPNVYQEYTNSGVSGPPAGHGSYYDSQYSSETIAILKQYFPDMPLDKN